jgi:uncharacterized protein (TIGR03118 family)
MSKDRTAPRRSASRRRLSSVSRAVVVMTGASLMAVTGTVVSAGNAGAATSNSFALTNLVANKKSAGAKLVDPNLENAWGLAAGPGDPIWVSDNNSNKVTVYSGGVKGSHVSLNLTVSVPGGNATGQVFNSTSGFPVGGLTGSPAGFIICSDSVGSTQSPGQIEAWNGGSAFVVEDSPKGAVGGKTPARAVFKGIAIAPAASGGPLLYAANVANATIDIFNKDFHPVSNKGKFVDPALPAGYAPFNIQLLNGDLYVTYGKQNKSKTDVVPGAGFGVVDVFTQNGALVKHLVANGSASPLNEPWGLALAPKGFGPFAGDLLVGNLGNGWINAFKPTTGAFVGTLDGTDGYPITIDGLWGLMVGNSSFGGSSSLVFSAGPAGYADGLLGVINPS